MRRLIALSTVLIGAAALGGAAHAGGNVVVNGDFSDGSSPWVSTVNGGGSDSVEINPSPVYGLPCINSACLNDEVNANSVDTLTQTVSGLNVGQPYVFSWEYGGRNGGGPQILDVSFGSTELATDTSDGVNSFWTLNSFTVIPTSSTETLTFASVAVEGSLPSYGNELTNVSLVNVPEPAAWALMLLGFGGVGAAMRSRRGKAALAA